jgi:DNA repair exonuclease SbcCD ATPase subunit
MDDNMNKFYISMTSRITTLMRYDVTAMSLGVDFENSMISEFETIYDETLPKLFKKINYYINTDYMISPNKTEYAEDDNINISMLIEKQQSVFKNLDDANYYLSQNLEESTDLIDRLNLHKETADNSLGSIVRFMENWMKKSNEELSNMENDLLNAETSLKTFNMEEMVEKAKKKIDRLKNKINKNQSNFKSYETLSNKLKANKDTIKKTLKDMKGFKGKLKKYLKKRQTRSGKMGKRFYRKEVIF